MKIFYTLLIILFCIFNQKGNAQAVTLTPQGNTSSSFSLATTTDVSQTGTPTVAQLIYNTNANITGTDANGIGYYFWNGSNWKSLDANIPQSTIIFSETHPNQTLINSGFSMIGTTQISTPALDVWRKISTANAPSTISSRMAFPYNEKIYLFGNSNNTRGIYDPLTDNWTVMDTINAPILNSQNYSLNYVRFKDRVLVFQGNNLSSETKIYNPNTNNWVNLSMINAPNVNWINDNRNSNKILILREGQANKILDVVANTWTDVSSVNAPVIVQNGNWSLLPLNLPNKYLVSVWENNQNNYHIYTVSTDEWSKPDTTNAPQGNEWHLGNWNTLNSGNDTSIVFTKENYNSVSNKFDIYFKRYSFQQNTWFDDLAPSLNNNSILYYIGNVGSKFYFYGSLRLSIHEFNYSTNTWSTISKHPDDLELRTTSTFIQMCGSKLIIYAGGNNNVTRIPWYNDGYMYDVTKDSWNYVPSLFGLVHESSLQPVLCCNDKFFSAFFNREHYMANNQIVNKSAIMQLSGSTNQTTQKLMYLYKKN